MAAALLFVGLVAEDDELHDPSLANREVEGEHQRVRKPALVEVAVDDGTQRDLVVVGDEILDCDPESLSEDVLVGPVADGGGASSSGITSNPANRDRLKTGQRIGERDRFILYP